ncbi:unnamed protein product [marine sediment metagenome]|uniref:Uncharacterized protein n=1 Tax=marine sediment metagenome TaxID=412755 RepID=X1M280_9ZZZZ
MNLREKLASNKFVVTVELDPPKTLNLDKILKYFIAIGAVISLAKAKSTRALIISPILSLSVSV